MRYEKKVIRFKEYRGKTKIVKSKQIDDHKESGIIVDGDLDKNLWMVR